MPEMLPLPREWYKEWEEGTRNRSATGLTEADIDEGQSTSVALLTTCEMPGKSMIATLVPNKTARSSDPSCSSVLSL